MGHFVGLQVAADFNQTKLLFWVMRACSELREVQPPSVQKSHIVLRLIDLTHPSPFFCIEEALQLNCKIQLLERQVAADLPGKIVYSVALPGKSCCDLASQKSPILVVSTLYNYSVQINKPVEQIHLCSLLRL